MSYKQTHNIPTKEDIEAFLTDMTNHGERMSEEHLYQALSSLHPTLQQAFWRIMKQIINRYAERENLAVDPRNQASVEFCSRLADSNAKFVGLPMI